MTRCVCVFNPASADGRVGRHWPAIQARLAADDLDCQAVAFTGADLTPALEQALDHGPCHTVVGVGGDGTHNAVLNALMTIAARRGEAPLPYLPLPFGTGNDIAKSLGIPRGARHLARYVDLARQDATTPLDLGRWGHLYFADAICVGLDAAILARRDAAMARLARRPLLRRLLGGYGLYVLAAVPLVTRPPRWHARVVVDGTTLHDGPAVNVVVNNTAIHAGELAVTPGARHDDGLLDVAVCPSLRSYLSACVCGFRRWPAAWRRPPVACPRYGRGRCISIHLDRPSPVQMDGELVSDEADLELTVHPAAIRVRTP